MYCAQFVAETTHTSGTKIMTTPDQYFCNSRSNFLQKIGTNTTTMKRSNITKVWYLCRAAAYDISKTFLDVLKNNRERREEISSISLVWQALLSDSPPPEPSFSLTKVFTLPSLSPLAARAAAPGRPSITIHHSPLFTPSTSTQTSATYRRSNSTCYYADRRE